jgi:hypothetical protein
MVFCVLHDNGQQLASLATSAWVQTPSMCLGAGSCTSLPEGDDECCICFDSIKEALERGEQRPVTQLPCWHTYTVILCAVPAPAQHTARPQAAAAAAPSVPSGAVTL